MRIISGTHSGRLFDAPSGYATHPMSERIRNALFNTLGDIEGLSLFDAYGGSGAVAFEAASRGANPVCVTDNNGRAFKTIQANIKRLGLEDVVSVSQANCISWLKETGKKFDVIIADPPFGKLQESQLNELVNYLTKSGIMVLSHTGRADTPRVDGVVVVKHRTYANAALTFYRLDE